MRYYSGDLEQIYLSIKAQTCLSEMEDLLFLNNTFDEDTVNSLRAFFEDLMAELQATLPYEE